MPELLCQKINKPIKWYNNPTFPLLPFYIKKEGNEYNTPGFSFSWLFIRIWSLDSFDFEFNFAISDHWGIGFFGSLPYLRWVFALPCPWSIQKWVMKNLWRKPKTN
jgi:hypothetical protein